MTTKPLSAERRKKVAEACLEREVIISGDGSLYIPVRKMYWSPEEHGSHYRALTLTTARLIEEADGPRFATLLRFNGYLATDDTNALEQLCAEMLEWKK